ncbi:MAG: restriction endonuclease subunit S [Fibrobacter sp.]|nr:restriction endonuclease subunit S [Fibrobacter sp.]
MSNTEWKEYKLGDIASFKYGTMPKKDLVSLGGQFPIYSGYRIVGSYPEYNLEQSELIIVARGVGGTGDVKLSPEKCFLTNLSIVAFLDESIILKKYAYYYFALNNLRYLDSGSAQSQITISDLQKVVVPVPPLAEQRRIVKVLSSLDDKIELNNAINRNLEEQAQAIFKSWFVDFEPFGGEMPENWEIGKIGDLVERTINGDWGKAEPMGTNTEEVFCIRGADIPEVKKGNKGKMPTRYILPKNYQQKKLEDGDLVVEISGGSPTQSTGRAAYISDALLERYNNKIVCTNFCKAIKFKNNYSTYMYFYWIYLYDKGIFFSYENGTTGIKNLDVSGILENEEIIIPSIDFLSKFNAYCSAAFKRISANGAETEQLGILRDSLLPKLMSGEIDLGR